VLGVVGESGCGKSTMGRCAIGLYEPTAGTVEWDGLELSRMTAEQKKAARRRFQMVFQNPFASLNPRQRIGDTLTEPLEVHGLVKAGERTSFAGSLLERVGLPGTDLAKYPHEFSGGQRQRIVLARALACQPDLLILDEPVSSLDVSVQASILNLLSRLNREQKISYVFISHDLQVVGYLSQRVLVMYLGRVVEEGLTEKVLGLPRHPYTQALLAASEGKKLQVAGEPPSPVDVPKGCAFHPRCPFSEKKCQVEPQSLAEVEKGWKTACWKWDQLPSEKRP